MHKTALKPTRNDSLLTSLNPAREMPALGEREREKGPVPLPRRSESAQTRLDPLQRYLVEIRKHRLLTREEEQEHGIRVQEHADKDAACALVAANLRLVVKIALGLQRVWMQNLMDLIQEGNIGLIHAVNRYDLSKNVKFSYYASFWIRAYILKFLMDNWSLVKIGTTQGQRKLFFNLRKEQQRLISMGFDPEPKLLSERLGVSEREIVDMGMRLSGWDVSLDSPVKEDSVTARVEFVAPEEESLEEQVSNKQLKTLFKDTVERFQSMLSRRELEIFNLRLYAENPIGLQELGNRHGVSRERVRQVEVKILRKLRTFCVQEIPDFTYLSAHTAGG